MEQSPSFVFEKQNIPLFIAGSTHINLTGVSETTYNLTIPAAARTLNMKFLYTQVRGSDTEATAIPTGDVAFAHIPRYSATAGQNDSDNWYLYTLNATDVANGYLTFSAIPNNKLVGGLFFIGSNFITPGFTPNGPGTLATTGFNRNITANTLASISTVAPSLCYHLQVFRHNGASRTITPPTGYTVIHQQQAGGGSLAGATNLSFASKVLFKGDVSGGADWTVSGAADLCLSTYDFILTV